MIRLPSIPDLPQSPGSGGINAPQVRAGAAAAPAAALSGLGRQLAQVSDQFFGTAIQMQKLKNARSVSEKRMTLQSEWTALALELEREADPEKMISRTQEFFQSRAGMVDDPELPPAVRDELGQFMADFSHRETLRISERAANKEIKRTALSLENEVDAAVQANDLGGAMGAIGRMVAAGVILPEEAEAMRRKVEDRLILNTHMEDILGDAAGWIEAHPRGEVPAGMDPGQWRSLYGQAEQEMRRQTTDDIETVLDAIHAGELQTEEQLEAAIGHLRPAVQTKLHSAWAARQSEGYQAMVNSPEYQAQVIGFISMRLESYNPAGDGFDEEYVAMDAAIRTLPTGNPVRAELLRQIRAAREGEKTTATDAKSHALKALDTAAKAGRFGPTDDTAPSLQRTQKALNDGFLRDRDKLSALGFSSEQVDEILAETELAGDRKRAATDLERRRRFERLWEHRTGEDQAEPYDRLVAQAIVNQETEIRDNTPEATGRRAAAVIETQIRIGEVKTQLMEWIEAHPQASPREIEEQLQELGGSAARESYRRSNRPPRPQRPAPIAPETSMNLPKPLAPLDGAFRELGAKYGIDPRFLAAIAMHETGGGTSRAFRQKNNAMGVSNAKGPISFEDSRESIERMARLLASTKSGPYRNARTIAEIGRIYAPPGAGNDPGNLNRHWTAGVSKFYRQLGGDPSQPLKS